MSIPVLIFGTGGNCVDILDTMLDCNDASPEPIWEPLGFLDDNPARHGLKICGVPVLGPLSLASDPAYAHAKLINGIGSPKTYKRKAQIIAQAGAPLSRFVTIVHPSASVSRTASLAPGVVVFQNVTITTNVTIEAHSIILPGSVISHDCVVGAYACIAGTVCLSGGIVIEDHVYVGAGAKLRQCVKVGAGALIGMGAVVVKDVASGDVVVGNPARLLRRQ